MIREMWDAIRACLLTFAVCALAVAYPALVFGIGHTLFPANAEGSLIERDGRVVGSKRIAQPFASDKYFWPRPSAVDYRADAAGGSNLGTKNPDLRKKIAERAESLRATKEDPVPADLVTASGSGLDPEISVEAADYQATRVASARGMVRDRVGALIEAHTNRSGALIGAPPRVNVLELNLALDGATSSR